MPLEGLTETEVTDGAPAVDAAGGAQRAETEAVRDAPPDWYRRRIVTANAVGPDTCQSAVSVSPARMVSAPHAFRISAAEIGVVPKTRVLSRISENSSAPSSQRPVPVPSMVDRTLTSHVISTPIGETGCTNGGDIDARVAATVRLVSGATGVD